jgi:hypothetical protein
MPGVRVWIEAKANCGFGTASLSTHCTCYLEISHPCCYGTCLAHDGASHLDSKEPPLVRKDVFALPRIG